MLYFCCRVSTGSDGWLIWYPGGRLPSRPLRQPTFDASVLRHRASPSDPLNGSPRLNGGSRSCGHGGCRVPLRWPLSTLAVDALLPNAALPTESSSSGWDDGSCSCGGSHRKRCHSWIVVWSDSEHEELKYSGLASEGEEIRCGAWTIVIVFRMKK